MFTLSINVPFGEENECLVSEKCRKLNTRLIRLYALSHFVSDGLHRLANLHQFQFNSLLSLMLRTFLFFVEM